jgi:acyl-CoA oxidase
LLKAVMDTITKRRLKVYLAHFNPTLTSPYGSLEQHSTNGFATQTVGHTPTFDVKKMSDILRGEDYPREEKEKYQKFVSQFPSTLTMYDVDKYEVRRIAEEIVKKYVNGKNFKVKDMKENPQPIARLLEQLGIYDASIGTKIAAHLILFAGSILNLGTKKHHDKYLEDASDFSKLPGCFAMTELTHGSNVKGLETTATYDPTTQEFIIHTPTDGATKWWIGNAQRSAKICTCFARLITKGQDQGIHAFIVPLRDDNHKVLPSIEIGDCGDKAGLHAVDNGYIKFDHVRIPRDNLLNRFGDVDSDGNYTSQFDTADRRFAAMLGELITGRVSITVSSLNFRRLAVIIATRYAFQRKQFGNPKQGGEIPIIDYSIHQVRLMPIIASCYALEFSKRFLSKEFVRIYKTGSTSDEELAEVHAMASAMKVITTWDTQQQLQTMRELCGGHGFSAYNRFGELRNDHDVFQTFEGDNAVLIQQLGAHLLKQFAQQFQGNAVIDSLQYLRKQMNVAIQDRNPVITRISSTKHLRSSKYYLSAFEYRTASLLSRCATDIAMSRRSLGGTYNAFNKNVPTIVQLGRAYVEHLTVREFVKIVRHEKKHGDRKLYEVLKLLCDLHALHCMHKDIGNFLEIVKSNKARAIEVLVQKLCQELSTHALSLVDAFEIPDFMIDAPIGKTDGNYPSYVLAYARMRNKPVKTEDDAKTSNDSDSTTDSDSSDDDE